MINAQMRLYDYYITGKQDSYGQPQVSIGARGQIKMAINISSQTIDENALYSGAQYTGLTHDAIDDTYIIQYGNEKLKVLYVNPQGRIKQVFMKRM